MRSMRFSTLLARYGPVMRSDKISQRRWNKAVAERRFMTVYHADNDWNLPVAGLVGHHGFVNTICKLAFAKPLPADVNEIIGMRDHQEAFEICNDIDLS